MKNKGIILFDIGNVLAENITAKFIDKIRAVLKIDFDQHFLQDVMNHSFVGDFNERQIYTLIGERTGINKSDLKNILYSLDINFNKNLLKQINLLREDFFVGVASDLSILNKSFLKDIGFFRNFERELIFLSCDLGLVKTTDDSYFFKIIRERLGDNKNVYLVDDNEAALSNADAQNIKSIKYDLSNWDDESYLFNFLT